MMIGVIKAYPPTDSVSDTLLSDADSVKTDRDRPVLTRVRLV
jgi:hypothetical protein